MTHPVCRVCASDNPQVLFHRVAEFTVTSAQVPTTINEIDVRLCPVCAHVQSREIDDLSRYYDSDYNFHLGDDETDDLYSVEGGQAVYRADHQLSVLCQTNTFDRPLRVLDYGCGKAATLRALTERFAPAVEPMVFDVSSAYTKYWSEFVAPENQAAFDIPDSWRGTCDLILSFFALEHVADPRFFAADLLRLLRPGGSVHVLVPNMYQNVNDILVVDHINHFSELSLQRLFSDAGFEDIAVDALSHKAAFVLRAKRPETQAAVPPRTLPPATDFVAAARAVASDCDALFATIEAHVAQTEGQRLVIYGSGIYGMMILASVPDRSRVMAFLDNNRFRQGAALFGVPIRAPREIPEAAEAVLVGLNPRIARQAIADMPFLAKPGRSFYYL